MYRLTFDIYATNIRSDEPPQKRYVQDFRSEEKALQAKEEFIKNNLGRVFVAKIEEVRGGQINKTDRGWWNCPSCTDGPTTVRFPFGLMLCEGPESCGRPPNINHRLGNKHDRKSEPSLGISKISNESD
jgi:hypothetical protein